VTARVLQITDVYDALTTERPYKPALTTDEALRTMKEEVEKGWWDPDIFASFQRMLVQRNYASVEPGRRARLHFEPRFDRLARR
jgi:HD-GYP domain-containing protein (c-di-GMP phosphodiesterase class II)